MTGSGAGGEDEDRSGCACDESAEGWEATAAPGVDAEAELLLL